jgi:hypothetical protein
VSLAPVSLAASGGDASFYAVFGVFVAAFAVLAVITLRWAVRRDRVGRAEWLRRRAEAEASGPTASDPPGTNGHGPPGRPGRRPAPSRRPPAKGRDRGASG